MPMLDFYVTVTHSQVVVFEASGSIKSLRWEDEHVAQGFVWSRGDVAFGVPDHDGICRIRVEQRLRVWIDTGSLWAIQVPFYVNRRNILVGTVMEQKSMSIEPGNYNVIFEAFSGRDSGISDLAYIFHITFSNAADPAFCILKSGQELSTDKVLREDAQIE